MAQTIEYKYDWQLIKALYIGGMTFADIKQIPKFSTLSQGPFYTRKKRESWDTIKEQARAEGTGQVYRALVLQLQEAINAHRQFMLDRLAHERFVFEKKTLQMNEGGKHQIARIEVLDKIDIISRRTLGMDKEAPVTKEQKNLQILIAMQGGSKQKVLVNESGKSSTGASQDNTVTVTIRDSAAPYEDPTRDIEAEAKAILEGVNDIETTPEPEGEIVARPGFHVPKPPTFGNKPLVNESANEVGDDLVDICKEAFPTAHVEVISEGTQEG